MKPITIFSLTILLASASCRNGENLPDAYGNFEANEVIVSALSKGEIRSFEPMEGTALKKGELVAVIDSTQLHLNLRQLKSGRASLRSRLVTLEAQMKAQKVQLDNLEREAARLEKLFKGGAATEKQMEDLRGQIELVKAQAEATESQKLSVYAEQDNLEIRILQAEDLIGHCLVTSPVDGVLLTKYRERGEVAAAGHPLFKVAPMEELILRAYISGSQLSQVTSGSTVRVMIDGRDGLEELKGEVSWISPQAEFTPKVIQTREERVSLVYAMKVVVPNDGRLKIGMPGEVFFR